MCYLKHVCCLCLTNSNEMTHYLSKAGETLMTYYEKLTASLPQLVFDKNYDAYMLCVECCKNIILVYEFSNRCIENLNTFLDFKRDLSSSTSVSGATLGKEDVEEVIHYKTCIEQDKSAKEGVEVMVYRNNFGQLESNNEVGMQMRLMHGLETKPLVTRHDQATDMVIREDISRTAQGGTEIKIEEELKSECLDYEFIVCDDMPDFCQLTGDENSAHHQLGESSKHTEHGCNEINNETTDKPSHSCEPQRSHVIKEEPTNDTSTANHSGARSDTCSSGVDVLRIHSTSEEEGSEENVAHDQLETNSNSARTGQVCTEINKTTGEKTTARYQPRHSRGAHSLDVINGEPTNDGSELHVTSLDKASRVSSDRRSCGVDDSSIHCSSEEEVSKLRHPSYVCDICDITFKNSRDLTKHKVVHTVQKTHVCEICKKGFSYLSKLVMHKRIHTGQKPYICDVCKKGFSQLSSMVRHKRMHTGERPYLCDVCNKGFSQSSALVEHKRIHTGQKPCICDICSKGFRKSSDLITHKRFHTGQKPHVCDICKKGFNQSSALVTHTRIHTGQKPYVCDICKKGFTESSALVRHKRIHTGQKPYVCDICKKGFRQSCNLVTHKRTHIGQKSSVKLV